MCFHNVFLVHFPLIDDLNKILTRRGIILSYNNLFNFKNLKYPPLFHPVNINYFYKFLRSSVSLNTFKTGENRIINLEIIPQRSSKGETTGVAEEGRVLIPKIRGGAT